MQAAQPEQATQFLSFNVAGGDFGLPILKVREILSYEGATAVPGTPASIRGVVNVRGAVVPVVDLAVKFGRSATEATNRTCVLVVDANAAGETLTVGLLAAAVNEVVELPAEAIEPPPAFGTGVQIDYLLGLGKTPSGFVLLLDLDRVLSASESAAIPALPEVPEVAEVPEVPEVPEVAEVPAATAP